MMSNFENKVAVITGATSGVGFEISLSLIKEGYEVYLLGRSFDKLKKAIIKIDSNNKIHLLKVDLSKEEEINNTIKKILVKNIDVLVHCAGFISYSSFELDTIKNFDLQYHINVRAPYLITQKLLKKIKKTQGQIIFIISTAGIEYLKNLSQYSASKHALKAISNGLRMELIDDKIKITNLFLGATNSPMQEKVQKLKGIIYDNERFIDTVELAKILLFIINLPKKINMTNLTLLPIG